MADDAGQEYAVPRYRDPEKAARIVEARRRGEKLKDIAAREGLSTQRVWEFCRDAGLTGRDPTTSPSAGKPLYEERRDGAATWIEIADAHGWRPDLRQPERRAHAALHAARRYAKANGLPWPLPDRAASERMARRDERARAASERRARAASERMARRDERGLAQVREMVEEERRVLALVEELPKDRTITQPEAERFLVELYRIGLTYERIAARTNCSHNYVMDVVRRRAPELRRPRGARRGKEQGRGWGQQAAPLLDLRELRNIWRSEERLRQINRPDARMFAAWLSGE